MTNDIPKIIKEKFQNGQLLHVADFEREQNFHLQHREFQTQQLFSPGVLTGLTVSSEGETITIAPGAAINGGGQQILLLEETKINITTDILSADEEKELVISDNYTAVEGQNNQLLSQPKFDFLATGTATTKHQVILANIKNEDGELIISVELVLTARLQEQRMPGSLDASIISDGVLNVARIPDLEASKITAGTLDVARIPDLDASKIHVGVLDKDRIPDLDASVITGGVLNKDRIPELDASKIITGALNEARIPNLDASKISTGILDKTRIPDLNASKVTDGVLDKARIPVLNASKISEGILDEARIPALNASKITEGKLAKEHIPELSELRGQITKGQLPTDFEIPTIDGLDASVIATGELVKERIPELSKLRGQITNKQFQGKLLPEQLPLATLIAPHVPKIFTPGVLYGMEVTTDTLINSLQISAGVAINGRGNILTFSHSTLAVGISNPATEKFLVMEFSTDASRPFFRLKESISSNFHEVVLGSVAPSLIITKKGRQTVKLQPHVTEISDLNFPLSAAQVPSLEELRGELSIKQLPFNKLLTSLVGSFSSAGILYGLDVVIEDVGDNTRRFKVMEGSVIYKNGAQIDHTDEFVIKTEVTDTNFVGRLVIMNSQNEGIHVPYLIKEEEYSEESHVILATAYFSDTEPWSVSYKRREMMMVNLDRLPLLQDFKGTLLPKQLPLATAIAPAIPRFFTPGILHGMEISIYAGTINRLVVKYGEAINEKGQIFKIAGAMATTYIPSNLEEDCFIKITLRPDHYPWFEFITYTAFNSIEQQDGAYSFILGTVKHQHPYVLTNEGRQDITFQGGNLKVPDVISPSQASQVPTLQHLKGKVSPKQLPTLQELKGQLQASQLSDDLVGQLSDKVLAQLPSEQSNKQPIQEIPEKAQLDFFVDYPLVERGKAIQLSWAPNAKIDSLMLTYIANQGIHRLSTAQHDIQLNQSYIIPELLQTTIFTLTAKAGQLTVAQKQLTVSVYALG